MEANAAVCNIGLENNQIVKEKYFDYSKRALWLRAVVLGGYEGLVFTTLLMKGSIAYDIKVTLLTSFTRLIAGALSLATAEFVSVYTQVDVMVYQAKRDVRMGRGGQRGLVPSPYQVSAAVLLTCLVGGTVPLLAAGFIRHHLRPLVAMFVVSLSMLVLGVIGASLGKTPIVRSCARILTGGWIAILISWGKQEILEYILGSDVKV